jgi:hypothetical protein
MIVNDFYAPALPSIGVAAVWGALLAAEEAAKLPPGEDWRAFVGVHPRFKLTLQTPE